MEVVETVKLSAEVIAASKFNPPVIAIAPTSLSSPPAPTVPTNWTIPLPMAIIKSSSEASPTTTSPKIILLLVVVRVLSALNVTAWV